MARLSLVVMLSSFALALAPVSAQEKKDAEPKQKPTPSLRVGDLAPPLKASKWLQGREVKGFEAGKVYVVEF